MTIYLNIPAGEILQAASIIKLFFSQLINENVKELPEQNPDLKCQCLLLMDEFTAMGKVEIIAKGERSPVITISQSLPMDIGRTVSVISVF